MSFTADVKGAMENLGGLIPVFVCMFEPFNLFFQLIFFVIFRSVKSTK